MSEGINLNMMVEKNVTIGKTKGITVIKLGEGDVMVTPLTNKREGYAGIGFTNKEIDPIGTKHNTAGSSTDETNPNAIIMINNMASLEVLERALAKAKINLRNIGVGEKQKNEQP